MRERGLISALPRRADSSAAGALEFGRSWISLALVVVEFATRVCVNDSSKPLPFTTATRAASPAGLLAGRAAA